jgi:hypothetical protein
MLDLWDRQGPPVHIAVAGYLGLLAKPGENKKGKAKTQKTGDLNELAAMFAGTGGLIGG